MIPEFDLNQRVALVTGGGAGIGKAIATLLAQRGARVVIAARKLERLEAAAHEITQATGQPVACLAADVTDAESAEALIKATVAQLGGLDILINNAGRSSFASLAKMAPDVWDKDIRLNLNAAYYCSHAAFPHLKASGRGAIVSISSQAGLTGTPGCGAYSAAKAGLQMFTRVAATEWGAAGIRVNCVAPGMVATQAALKSWEKTGFDAEKAAQTAFALRRPAQPEEIAQAVAFLASDAASYITGETLAVNGGPGGKGMIETD